MFPISCLKKAQFFYHQFDVQTSCLFTYNTLIKILYMFRAYPAHLQEVYVVLYICTLLYRRSVKVSCLKLLC